MEGPASDAALLIGVAERDIGAFRALYERHAGRLARRCNDSALVADALQDNVRRDLAEAAELPR